jgi:hypothetical protein
MLRDSLTNDLVHQLNLHDGAARTTVRVKPVGLTYRFEKLVVKFRANGQKIGNTELRVMWPASGPSRVDAIHRPAVATDCDQTWTQVKKWIERCVATHTACNSTQVDRFLPTRLIDVGTTADDVRLCSSQTLPSNAKYMTLSHCWGKLVNRRSLLSTYPQCLSIFRRPR